MHPPSSSAHPRRTSLVARCSLPRIPRLVGSPATVPSMLPSCCGGGGLAGGAGPVRCAAVFVGSSSSSQLDRCSLPRVPRLVGSPATMPSLLPSSCVGGGGSCGGDAVGCTAAVDSFPSARPDALLLLPCAPSSVGSSDVLCRRVRRTRRLAMQGGGSSLMRDRRDGGGDAVDCTAANISSPPLRLGPSSLPRSAPRSASILR